MAGLGRTALESELTLALGADQFERSSTAKPDPANREVDREVDDQDEHRRPVLRKPAMQGPDQDDDGPSPDDFLQNSRSDKSHHTNEGTAYDASAFADCDDTPDLTGIVNLCSMVGLFQAALRLRSDAGTWPVIDRPAPRRRPTLARIAAELGVSVMSVSNAYNRPDQLSPALRERILEKARELGYPGRITQDGDAALQAFASQWARFRDSVDTLIELGATA